jgi:hypothetical protein
VAPTSPAGTALSPAEQKSVVAAVDRAYPGYPPVADLPTIGQENVKAVARELAAEDPADLPTACADPARQGG